VAAGQSRLEVIIDLAVKGLSELKEATKATGDIGKEAESSGGGFASLAKGLVTAGGGAIAAKKGFDWLKGAAEQSAQLSKDTAALTRTTGMSAQSSSAWVSIAKSRGIETNTLAQSMTIFSKNIRGAEQGSKAAAGAFSALGISQKQLAGLNTEQAINAVADAFQNLPDGADKAALAQQLFGRQSRSLLPLLNSGSEGIREQQKAMADAGLTMDEAGVKKGLEMAKTQRELKATMDGLKVTIGSAVLPVLVELLKAFAAILKPVASAIRGSGALRAVLGPLAVGLGALAIALKIASVAMLFGAAAATALWTALGVGIIVAVIAAFVVLYQKVGWFRDIVQAVWGWIKSNWPLLAAIILGPLLGPILLLVLNFGKIKDAAVGAFQAVVGAIGSVIGAIGNVIGAIGRAAAAFGQKIAEMAGFVASLPGRIAGAALAAGKALIEGIANGIKSAGDAIMSAIESVVPEPIKKVLGGIKGFLEKISPFQSGGLVPSGGRLALVGEAGPELLSLPGGSQVIPLQAGTAPAINVGALGGEIHVHLEVEGRELARAVARVAAETQAAR
jgi:hypothetical protein